MNINKKIEQIRQKPEHVRMKYVWGAVAACMFFIVIIWIISVKAMFHQSTAGQDFNQLKESFGKSSDDMPSISNLSEKEGAASSLSEQDSVLDGMPANTTTPTQQNQMQQQSDAPLEKSAPQTMPQQSSNTTSFPSE